METHQPKRMLSERVDRPALRATRTLVCLAMVLFRVGALAEDKTTYGDQARPLFQSRCFSCHNSDKKKGGLDLTSYGGVLAGGSGGPVVDGGNHTGSRLWKLTARKEQPHMPPEGDPLKPSELEVLAKWIDGGVLETASSVARKSDKPKLDLVVVSTDRPSGPPPMPEHVLMEPVMVSERANAVTALASAPWSSLFAVSGTGQVVLYDADSLEVAGILPYPEGGACSLRFSRNGSLLVVGGGHGAKAGNAVLFDVKTGRRVAEVGKEQDTVLAADVRCNHAMVAIGTPGKKVKVFDTAGNELYVKDKHSDWVTAVAFSPDGVLLATGDRNGGVRVWESDGGGEYLNLEGHRGAITALSWRPDSNLLASSSEDGDVILWEMNDGGQVKRWTAHGGGTLSVDYASDGKLATSGRDRHVKAWNGDGGLLKDLGETVDLPTRVAWVQDGKRLLVGVWNGDVTSWSLDSGKPVGTVSQNPATLDSRIALAEKRVAELAPKAQAAEQAKATAAQALASTEGTVAEWRKKQGEARARAEQLKKDLAEMEQKAAEAEKQAVALAPQLAAQQKEVEAKTAAWQAIAGDVAAGSKKVVELKADKFNVTLLAEQELLAKLEGELATRRDAVAALEAQGAEARKALEQAKAAVTKADQDVPALEAAVAKLTQEREARKSTVEALKAGMAAISTRVDESKRSLAAKEQELAEARKLVEQMTVFKPAALLPVAGSTTNVAEMDPTRRQLAEAEKVLSDQAAAVARLRIDLAVQATNACNIARQKLTEAEAAQTEANRKLAEAGQMLAAKNDEAAKAATTRDATKTGRQVAVDSIPKLEKAIAESVLGLEKAKPAMAEAEQGYVAQQAKVSQLRAQFLALLPK